MLTGINESKILTKHISCKCKCKFNGRKCNSNQKFNNDKCWCEWKKRICKQDFIWILISYYLYIYYVVLHAVAKMVLLTIQ